MTTSEAEAVKCPKCRRFPETIELEHGGIATTCTTATCRNGLFCLGDTKEASIECWNHCIERREYR